MSETIVYQYTLNRDVTTEHREIVELASGELVINLDIDDVNSFLNGLYLFHKEAEEELWTNLF
jgi:hypothetical protein